VIAILRTGKQAGPVRYHERLGGLLKSYYRNAA